MMKIIQMPNKSSQKHLKTETQIKIKRSKVFVMF